MVLATFGVVCRAQMTPQDASGVTSCETELASCQAVLDAVGAQKAEDVVPLAASSSSRPGKETRTYPLITGITTMVLDQYYSLSDGLRVSEPPFRTAFRVAQSPNASNIL